MCILADHGAGDSLLHDRGAFTGVPATGKEITWQEIHIVRLAGGVIVEHWGEVDAVGMLQQLGAIPASGSAPA